jgi:hypothetical protein
MARTEPGKQQQDSRQSGDQGGQSGASEGSVSSGVRPGIGSSQAQDKQTQDGRAPRDRPSAGTPDIERAAGEETTRGNTNVEDSLVGDPTGAFKERP